MPKDYKQRVDNGICTACGSNPAQPGYVRCPDCRAAAAKLERDKREKRMAAGLCRSCGKYPPRAGSKDCPDCLARYAQYRRAK